MYPSPSEWSEILKKVLSDKVETELLFTYLPLDSMPEPLIEKLCVQLVEDRQDLEAFFFQLSAHFSPEDSRAWMQQPHPQLDGRTPLELLLTPELVRVRNLLPSL